VIKTRVDKTVAFCVAKQKYNITSATKMVAVWRCEK